ncbi:MAG: Stealth CR1 domain-containing protein [Victivallales bacterium]|nr:Stealth CR1 domain-containing protein [Victivallales bacterium]
MDKIDFVLPWVDGSDLAWLEQKRKYENGGERMAHGDADANADCRYRDYGLLKYWFRAVERFAPWVNRLFFVTCGQKPDWLDEANPRLVLVNHSDYIPADYLPTFNSNTIELNLHRISELSERFVLLNDDVFIIRPIQPDFFFKEGKPVISCDLGIPRWLGCSNISRIALNNSGVLKLSLDVERLVWKNIWKYIDVRALGFSRAIKNLASFVVNRVVIEGTFGHLAQPHLKSTLEEIWRAQPGVLERTSKSRFRTDDGVNQWLVSAWDMISGRFFPANEKRKGEFITLDEKSLAYTCEIIRQQKRPQLCLNDKGGTPGLEHCFEEVAKAFEELLLEKSSFEK